VVVRRGEYLERAVVIPGDPPLEGLFHRGPRRPAVLVAPPHPERGGGMEGPVVAELAWALTRAGFATLRFSYPGLGASGGAFTLEAARAARDRAAAHLSESTGGGPVAGVGLGFGGGLLAEVAPTLAELVWIRPDPAEPLPEPTGLGIELTVVVPGGEDPAWRGRVQGWAESAPRGRIRVVPRADPAFLQGLVTLGRVVAEVLAPPGDVALE
jgi:hypothetical protein